MRKSRCWFSLLTCIALLNGCVSHNVVKKVSLPYDRQTRANEMRGVFYALPQTVVAVTVTVNRTAEKPGKYEKFASFFFPDQPNIIHDKKVGFELDPSKITVSLSGEPDPNEIYLAEIQGGWFGGFFEDKALSVELTNDGILKSGEAETTNQALPIALETVAAIAGIVKSAAFTAGAEKIERGADLCSQREPPSVQRTKKTEKDETFIKQLRDDQKSFYQSLTNEEKEFYQSLNGEERGFYQSLNSEERDFYQSLNAVDRGVYRSVPDEVRLAYQELCFGERVFVRRLSPGHRVFYLSLDNAERRQYQGMLPSERENYRRLAGVSEEDKRYYAQLTPEEKKKFADSATNREEFRQAKKVYEQIKDLQETRANLLSVSNVSGNAEAIQLQLKELDAQLGKLTQHFFGTKKQEEWIGTFDFVPPKINLIGTPTRPRETDLLNFSEKHGVCSLNPDVSGPAADFNVKPCLDPQFENDFTLRLQVLRGRKGRDEDQPSTVIGNASLAQTSKRGFYYRIPADALAKVVKVKPGGAIEEATRQGVSIAQYGETVSLPSSSGGRRTKYSLTLSESTGALKNFTLGSDALIEKSMVEKAGGIATSLIDAKKAQEAAEATAQQNASDELKQLTRRRQILEEMVKIKKAEADLKPQ